MTIAAQYKVNGEMLTIREASEKYSIALQTLKCRARKSSLEAAVNMGQPLQQFNTRSKRKAKEKPQTSIAAPRGRLEVYPGEAPSIFAGKIGQYEATGSAIERAAKERDAA